MAAHWIDPKNQEQQEWIYNYLSKHRIYIVQEGVPHTAGQAIHFFNEIDKAAKVSGDKNLKKLTNNIKNAWRNRVRRKIKKTKTIELDTTSARTLESISKKAGLKYEEVISQLLKEHLQEIKKASKIAKEGNDRLAGYIKLTKIESKLSAAEKKLKEAKIELTKKTKALKELEVLFDNHLSKITSNKTGENEKKTAAQILLTKALIEKHEILSRME